MKNVTRTVLSKLDLMPPQGDLQCTARITKHMNIQAYIDGTIAYNLKFSDGDDLTPELKATQSAYEIFPNSVAWPHGIVDLPNCQVFVSDGTRYTPLSRKLLKENHPLLVDNIVNFLTNPLLRCPKDKALPAHSETIVNVLEHFRLSRILSYEDIAHLTELSKELVNVPHILQQGDFALTNIGITDSGLVVFDWEDYGAVTMPGFDLCILMCSFLKYNPTSRKGIYETFGSQSMTEIVLRVCQHYEISVRSFWQLVPVYIVMFAYLKDTRGYGELIRDRLIDSLPFWFSFSKTK